MSHPNPYLSLSNHEAAIYGCTTLRCGCCGTSCPGFGVAGFESNTPRGRMRIARGVLEGELELTDTLVERVFFCNQCGYCTYRCSFNPVDVVFALKAEIVKAGRAPQEVYSRAESIKNHNMCFQPHEKRLECLPAELRTPGEADVLLFLSCFPAYTEPKSVQATARILDEAGVKWTTLGEDEWCCGYPMLEYGMPERAEALLKHNVAAINDAAASLGVRAMVTSCPSCAKWFKRYPGKFGLTLDVKVMHTTELFSQLIGEGKLQFKEWSTTCVYHDACSLGRGQGVYEEPREILRAIPGLRLVEADANRDQTLCCGSIPYYCGPRSFQSRVDPRHVRLAHGITRGRIRQLEQTGADTVVAACTGCVHVLDGMKDRRSKIEVIMISEALSRHLIRKT